MTLTDYQAKYIAIELTRRFPPDSVEKIAAILVDAQVDLNPHQIDAALFAFRSPLSRGALLADEVGLGKTIEAGLVLSQKWAERKRRILVITPSNLRKQWYQELTEKFFLPCRLLESKSYNTAVKQGCLHPFEALEIVICSYQFAKSKAGDIQAISWDLVVIDEAHRLRNVYKPSNVIANVLKVALAGKDKLLLTATPLQNSLLELFGLTSFIDEHIFGDLKSFREQFANLNQDQVFDTLKARLRPVCHRTLRRQVLPYIKYTKRLPLVQEFTPEESEDRLYHLVSDYLQRDNLQALPASQRTLMTLVLRKLLASSTFAIAGALTTLSGRLKARLEKAAPTASLEEELNQDYEALDETAEEWNEDAPEPTLSEADRLAIEREIADLDAFRELAVSIEHNAEGKALLRALEIAFAKAAAIGAAQKAVIFTESRLVVNYDLPWNPQRIEQRIGRCHRYGQQHDVVVVNFLNRNNAADQRVFQLLSEKFQLFEGVFGASDEVLGAIESGVDFEKRIAAIYQCCRKPDEIQAAFDRLQLELNQEIDASLTRTRQQLLENFDDEVREKLKIRDDDSKAYLNRFERLLMQLTRYELNGNAEFPDDSTFRLKSHPFPEKADRIPLGFYELPRRSGEAHLYRLNHLLAEALLTQAKGRELPPAELHFDYGRHDGKVSILESFLGQSGWLVATVFTVEALDLAEDYLIVAAVTDQGTMLDEETASRLLSLPGSVDHLIPGDGEEAKRESLDAAILQRQIRIQKGISERNARFFEAEADKLDGWADDLKVGLEREIKELDRQIKETRRAATAALTLEEKLAGQKQIKALEAQRNQKRRSLFDAQDDVDRQREALIAQIEGKLKQKETTRSLFWVRWVLRS